ncbi:5'-nucleotidase [Xylophilus sp.]|uniref:5'-nucleotidase n=1 Tax=Xylophilus sp. TaxID=2653893 RepID=UPI0013B5E348|nr:5'-nucleotidase [Xylophilus sp.]KAF1049000.1 MAG: hypothetical protein GAK38_01115 [Xylophilus sp.]
MPITLDDKLVVAISSRALFDFAEENRVFDPKDPQPYMQLQLERRTVPAKPGVAYPLVHKLLKFNTPQAQRVEVVLLSRNDPVSALRIFHSAKEAALPLERGVFTQGRDPFRYLEPLGADLFLSANHDDVREALALGYPAARVLTESVAASATYPDELRIAFDGDAVLFSDEAERVYQAQGLAAFQAHETSKAALPLSGGPFKPLLAALSKLRRQEDVTGMRIRTALVTARSAPAHERAINTLMEWKLSVDEAMFLGGLEKGPFLRQFEPDFFFDDQNVHVDSAARHVPAGHVGAGPLAAGVDTSAAAVRKAAAKVRNTR